MPLVFLPLSAFTAKVFTFSLPIICVTLNVLIGFIRNRPPGDALAANLTVFNVIME